MLRWLARRLLGAAAVLWVVLTASFFLLRFAPGGPLDADRRLPPAVEANRWLALGLGQEVRAPAPGRVEALGPAAPGDDVQAGALLARLRTQAGRTIDLRAPAGGRLIARPVRVGQALDLGARVAVLPLPLGQQYLAAMRRYARLDFGVTLTSGGTRRVADNLLAGLPISAELGLWALLLALLLGVPAGFYAGLHPRTWGDRALMGAAMLGLSVPPIVAGPLLIAVFALGLGWLPYGAWESWQDRVLPVVTLALVYVALFARLARAGMLEVRQADFLRAAHAKGLSPRQVVLRHALKPAILPVVSYLGPAAAQLLTGSVVVERLYGLPGLSEYFVGSALGRDYPMVLGAVFVYTLLLVGLNLLVDLVYPLLDPRVRLTGGRA